MRVMAIACPLSTSRSRGCQKERRSLCHSRSSARQLHLWLSTRHFQSFPFFLLSFYRSHFPSLSLLFTWNRFIFVHPWESVFGGCVLYPRNGWEIQMAWWTIFETEMKRSSSAVPLTPLYFSTLLDTLDVLSSLWDGFISPDTESSFVYDSPPSSSSSSSSCFLTLYVCPVCDKELTKRVAASPVATFHLAFYPTSKSRDVRDNSISPCCFSWRFPVMQSHHSHTA